MPQRFALSLALALIIGCGISPASAQQAPLAVACAMDQARFQLPDGNMRDVAVELADTAESRATGLMFRESLAPGHGMLFIYETPQPVAFWMKNTLIPLDMVFIDPTGRVAHIHPGAVPHDETPIPGSEEGDPDPGRLMVLEVAAGEAARLGLVEGAILAHPGLAEVPGYEPALPCE